LEEKGKYIPILLGIAFFLIVTPPFIKYAIWEVWGYGGSDFETFYQAAQDLSEGKSPYPAEVLEGLPSEMVGEPWGNYIYPPLFARLLIPLTQLPLWWCKKGYLLVCLVLYFWLLYPRRSDSPGGHPERWATWAILLGWGPVIVAFRYGQSDFIPLFLIFFAWRLLGGRMGSLPSPTQREFVAGFIIGVASMVKVTPLLMFPAFVAALRFRLAVGMLVGALSALLISGPVTSYQYFTKVLPAMTDFAGMGRAPSIHIVAYRAYDHLGFPDDWSFGPWSAAETFGLLVAGLLFGTVLITLFLLRKRMTTADLVILTSFLPPLFAGEVSHHYVLAILPVIVASRRLTRELLRESGPVDWGSVGNRLLNRNWITAILLIIATHANFFYWEIPKDMAAFVWESIGVNGADFSVVGNAISFVLIFPFFLKQEPDKPREPS